MPAQYVNVTQNEMEEHLLPQGFKRVTVPGTVELVYAKRVDRDELQLSLRVYTGIVPSGNSRGVGEDAMRVTIFQRTADGVVKMAGGSKRVHRVRGWRKNLQNRIDAWEDLLGPQCPTCGNLMVERDGRNGKFYGCSNYPDCRQTLPLNGASRPARPSRDEVEAEMEIREIEGGQM
jgi:hypothetical protein